MRFAAGLWLWALLLLPLLALVWIHGERRAHRRVQAALGPRAAIHVEGRRTRRRAGRRALLLGGLACLILALARPQWGAHSLTIKERGADVVIALDISNSMLAQDVSPSRLELAKATLASFLDGYDRGRVGLVLFAGAAYVQCPLTLDIGTARLFLAQAAPDMISRQGTAIGAALGAARDLLTKGRDASAGDALGAIVLVTDGEDFEGDWQSEADACRQAGIVIVPVGLGTEAGGLVPGAEGEGYLKDESGAVVLSRFAPRTLEALAERGEGTVFHLGAGGFDSARLRDVLKRLRERDLEERQISAYEERFIWPLALALLLLAAREAWRPWRRRGPALPARRATEAQEAAVLPPADAGPASPAPPADRGAGASTPARAAAAAVERRGSGRVSGRHAAAAVAFLALLAAGALPAAALAPLRPEGAAEADRGRAHYRAGRYEEALQAFEAARASNPDDARLTLAVGEALARLGRRDDALREFTRARGQARTDDLRAEGFYNEGATLLDSGDASGAVKALRRAVALAPAREDARRDLELALQRLQQAPPSGSSQQQKEGSNDKDQRQDQQQQDQKQGQSKEQQGQDQPPDQSGQQRQDRQPPAEQPPASDSARAGPAGEPEAMSREQAADLLRALDRDELELRRAIQKRLRGKPTPGGKPW